MCGIAGFIDIPYSPQDYGTLLARMLGAIQHRGPNEQGVYFDNKLGLGAVRLSVIDLSSGTQPINSEDGRYWIVFNGEIFNFIELRGLLLNLGYRFRTQSDTEVLLYALIAWGEEALNKLDGQFAFAFYDRVTKNLLLGRDPYGERPLFYTFKNKGIVFASEIKALFCLPGIERKLSLEGLSEVFQYWSSIGNKTCFQNVYCLQPGHIMRIMNGQYEVKPYYILPVGQSPLSLTYEDAEIAVRDILNTSVKRRLRSDVEVGCYLSGGLDSTIVTALARHHRQKSLRTFSISFQEQAFDESSFQKEAARYIDIDAFTLSICNTDINQIFPEVVRHAETALFRTALAPMYYLAREVRNQGIKVVLTGEGADEAFLGYDLFKEALFRANFSNSDHASKVNILAKMYSYLPHFNAASSTLLLRYFNQFSSNASNPFFSHEMRFVNGSFASHFLKHHESENNLQTNFMREVYQIYPDFDYLNLIERAQILEYMTLLSGYLLSSQGDRMTSAHGVESRSPFLSREVVDFAFKIPQEYRLGIDFNEKRLLKSTFSSEIPLKILNRPKQPYRSPDAAVFLGNSIPEWLENLTTRKFIEEVGVFDEGRVVSFLEKMKTSAINKISPRDDQAMILLVSTLLLHDIFIRQKPLSKEISRFDRYVDATNGELRLEEKVLQERLC